MPHHLRDLLAVTLSSNYIEESVMRHSSMAVHCKVKWICLLPFESPVSSYTRNIFYKLSYYSQIKKIKRGWWELFVNMFFCYTWGSVQWIIVSSLSPCSLSDPEIDRGPPTLRKFQFQDFFSTSFVEVFFQEAWYINDCSCFLASPNVLRSENKERMQDRKELKKKYLGVPWWHVHLNFIGTVLFHNVIFIRMTRTRNVNVAIWDHAY